MGSIFLFALFATAKIPLTGWEIFPVILLTTAVINKNNQ
jgi:hypothetical protein